MKFFTLAAVALVGLSSVGVARADTITVDSSFDFTVPDFVGTPIFYQGQTTFNLPAGFTNAQLKITGFTADDRAVLELNSTVVASTGIANPDGLDVPPPPLGQFFFDPSGLPNNDFFFTNTNDFQVFAAITGPFVVGTNTLDFIVNNTFHGLFGPGVPDNPGNYQFSGTVTFDAATTPLPAALPLFATGLGALGLLGWRRKRKAAALAA